MTDEDFDRMFSVESGVLRWKISRTNAIKVGDVAGSINTSGHRQVYINGRLTLVHRIIWERFNGPIKRGLVIDHINGIRDDNRIENLRCVNIQTNNQNIRKARAHNKSTGLLGVTFNKASGKFVAQAYDPISKKRKHLGRFDSAEAAHHVYMAYRRENYAGNIL